MMFKNLFVQFFFSFFYRGKWIFRVIKIGWVFISWNKEKKFIVYFILFTFQSLNCCLYSASVLCFVSYFLANDLQVRIIDTQFRFFEKSELLSWICIFRNILLGTWQVLFLSICKYTFPIFRQSQAIHLSRVSDSPTKFDSCKINRYQQF